MFQADKDRKARWAVVYYIKRGGLVKIGTTIDMTARMAVLDPDEILATEPGSYDLERERLKQFRHLLAKRAEWFYPGEDLLSHIAEVAARHGNGAAA